MTDFEMLSLFPGLISAGHEATANFLCTALSHLLHTGQYNAAQLNNDTRTRAIEELLRYESAIMGMRRGVTITTVLGGTTLKKGDVVFLAYVSGSRDEKYFLNPDELNINRQIKEGHLAFGRGIHACVGAPLARLILGIELSVIAERLPNLRLAVPYEALEYLPVSIARGILELPVAWDTDKAASGKSPILGSNKTRPGNVTLVERQVIVESKVNIADRIVLLKLRAADGNVLPTWTPGAHIDVAIDEKNYRQFSLCGDPHDSKIWQIAVLLEAESHGGSIFIHQKVKEGDLLIIRGPRNNFHYEKSQRQIFIAGGIGITPIKAMIAAAIEQEVDWKLIYLGRKRSSMAFEVDLRVYGDRVTIWPGDEQGHFDLSFLSKENPEGLQIYCCGPERLMSAVETACASFPIDTLRVERFAPKPFDELASVNQEIEVVLIRSGITLIVPPKRSILEVVNEAGAGILSTCQKGTCGTCEIRVLEGEPDHRDSVLTASEKASNEYMTICVSRCKGKRLVLDI